MSKRISFSVPDDKKEEIEAVAKDRGFRGSSDLARFTLYQYLNRYPLKNGLHVRADATESKIKEVSDLE